MAGYCEEKKHKRQCLEAWGTDGVRLMRRKFDVNTGDDIGLHMVEPLTREQIEQRLGEAQRAVADLEEMLKDFDELQAGREKEGKDAPASDAR